MMVHLEKNLWKIIRLPREPFNPQLGIFYSTILCSVGSNTLTLDFLIAPLRAFKLCSKEKKLPLRNVKQIAFDVNLRCLSCSKKSICNLTHFFYIYSSFSMMRRHKSSKVAFRLFGVRIRRVRHIFRHKNDSFLRNFQLCR